MTTILIIIYFSTIPRYKRKGQNTPVTAGEHNLILDSKVFDFRFLLCLFPTYIPLAN